MGINLCLMKTLGDKRLETHLLAGIEKVFLQMKDEDKKTVAERIKAVYKKHGFEKAGDELKSYDWAII